METYESDSNIWRKEAQFLNPLVFWWHKKTAYPSLYKLALKLLAVPSTSVLSEQTFSGAGRISTKERSSLSKATIEKLVLLQRSMTKADVLSLTADDFREERRLVLIERRNKARLAAYK